jgi:hypothetical protein
MQLAGVGWLGRRIAEQTQHFGVSYKHSTLTATANDALTFDRIPVR